MAAWRRLPLPDHSERIGAKVKAAAMRVHREVGAGFRENSHASLLMVHGFARVVHPRFLVWE